MTQQTDYGVILLSKQREKGTRFETAVAEYLRLATGQDVTRRALSGANDKGDLRGLRINGDECVVECKNCNSVKVSEWLNQARKEAANADADFCVVVFHRKGVGLDIIKMGDQAVLMDLDTFARIIGMEE